MSVHTIPLNDEREHAPETDCWCEPRVEWVDPETGLPWAEGGALVIHNAADCREVAEAVTGESVEPDKEWRIIET